MIAPVNQGESPQILDVFRDGVPPLVTGIGGGTDSASRYIRLAATTQHVSALHASTQ